MKFDIKNQLNKLKISKNFIIIGVLGLILILGAVNFYIQSSRLSIKSEVQEPKNKSSIVPINNLKPTQEDTGNTDSGKVPANSSVMPTPTSNPISTKDAAPPIITADTQPHNGEVWSSVDFCPQFYVTDDVSKYPKLWTKLKIDSENWSDWQDIVYPKGQCYNLSNGNHTFLIQAKDEAGNTSSIMTRTFSIQRPQDIRVTVGGHIFNDKNCNDKRDEGDSGITGVAGTQVNLFKLPEFYILETSALDNDGWYSFSKTIKDNESLSIDIGVVAPTGYKIHIRPITVTLDKNNKSITVDTPVVPYESVGLCQ